MTFIAVAEMSEEERVETRRMDALKRRVHYAAAEALREGLSLSEMIPEILNASEPEIKF